MATAYSSEVAIGTYNRIRLRVEYSRTSATCYIEFRRTSSWTDTWGDTLASITFNGVTVSAPYWYSGTVGTDWVQLVSASGFSISTSASTYNWSFNNPQGVLGCSGAIYIGAQAVPPSGGYISNITSYWDTSTNEIRVHTTAAGVMNDGGATIDAINWGLYEAPYVSGAPRCSIAITNGAASTLSNSLNTYGGSTIDVAPNKTLYPGLYAHNSAGDYRYKGNAFVTVPGPSSISAGAVTTTSVTVDYATTADGGVYDKKIQYTTDGGTTWVDGATVTGGASTTGSFTISGLLSGTAYNIQTRVTTSAGSTTGPTISVQTIATDGTTVGLYGSVSGLSAKARKLYGAAPSMEVTGVTGTIDPEPETVSAFDANVFWSKHAEFESLNVRALEVTWGGRGGTIYLYFTDSPDPQTLVGPDATIADCASYGVTVVGRKAVGDSITLTPVYSPTGPTATTPIIKLYGSVRSTATTGNVAKLIYQAGC